MNPAKKIWMTPQLSIISNVSYSEASLGGGGLSDLGTCSSVAGPPD